MAMTHDGILKQMVGSHPPRYELLQNVTASLPPNRRTIGRGVIKAARPASGYLQRKEDDAACFNYPKLVGVFASRYLRDSVWSDCFGDAGSHAGCTGDAFGVYAVGDGIVAISAGIPLPRRMSGITLNPPYNRS